MRTGAGRFDPAWWWALPVLAAVALVRLCLGFEFPIPWNDETAFVSQAFEFAHSGSFYVYGLNAERPLMWMPPGLMLVQAAVFRVFGYSFELARGVSCLLYLGAFALALAIVAGQFAGRRRFWAAALTALAFTSPYALAISNLARMEALYTLLFLGSLLALLRGRPWLGLSAVLLGGLVHFNAVYFLVPYALWLGASLAARRWPRMRRSDAIALAFTALCLAGYGAFVVAHLDGFIEDMRFQFGFKLAFQSMDGPWGWLMVGALLGWALLTMIRARGFPPAAILILHGAAFAMLALNGHNMWYRFGLVFGFWLCALGALASLPPAGGRLGKGVLAGALALSLVAEAGYAWTPTAEFAPLWPRKALFQRDFLAPAELDKVRAFIAGLPPGSTVSFGYSGVEPFFLEDFARTGSAWTLTAHSATQVFPAREPDYRVLCDSSLFPAYLYAFDWDGYPRQGLDSGCRIVPLRGPRSG
ncbi:hypothetical protein [Pseudomonas sp. RIT-PI-AD]|uniref:hypothetical protein n=1 Tax=Pseudomonas sp. RIT-PI-AD TaxID=3035294 RepID=UPI0021DA197D|nr:hypothetical protein [Pseudomonas sp. RIT-PI-AD]